MIGGGQEPEDPRPPGRVRLLDRRWKVMNPRVVGEHIEAPKRWRLEPGHDGRTENAGM